MRADAAAGRPAKRSNWGTAGSRWWPKPRAWGSGRFAAGVKNCVTSRGRRVLPAGGFGAREAGANRSRTMILTWSPRWKRWRSEEHTSELQSLAYLVCRLLLEKKKNKTRL